jgi:hypothetical protein
MITFKTAPQGTATVTEAHAQSMRDLFAGLKPLKPTKIKAHARRFPHPNGFWSTEDYIRQYFALNFHMKIAAYGPDNHVSLYHPLPDRVARLNPSEPEVEGS